MRKKKFRIVFNCNRKLPFELQIKKFIFWKSIYEFQYLDDAKRRARFFERHSGKIFYETGKESEAKEND